ncbi:MAG: hypothetical protein LBG72_08880, partial [Spirochaetaceae bacterium]|nr:hypothetical protein [Spirochaetaceae bacterium]
LIKLTLISIALCSCSFHCATTGKVALIKSSIGFNQCFLRVQSQNPMDFGSFLCRRRAAHLPLIGASIKFFLPLELTA